MIGMKYEACREGLGLDFIDDFISAVRVVAEAPNRWPAHMIVPGVKRYRLKRFPFALAYRVENDHWMIYAVEDLR